MKNVNTIKEKNIFKSHAELESFFNELFGCDVKELYSLLLCASLYLNEIFESTKQEKYLKKSKRLKEIYTRLFQNVFAP